MTDKLKRRIIVISEHALGLLATIGSDQPQAASIGEPPAVDRFKGSTGADPEGDITDTTSNDNAHPRQTLAHIAPRNAHAITKLPEPNETSDRQGLKTHHEHVYALQNRIGTTVSNFNSVQRLGNVDNPLGTTMAVFQLLATAANRVLNRVFSLVPKPLTIIES